MVKVSIVVPCYNHGQYIDKAVHSMINQTFSDLEIIIINDGSTDEYTINKLKKYNKAKTRVLHTDNHGPSAARNFGILQAKGEYILALDADDYYHPTFLEKGLAIFKHALDVGLVTCGIQHFGLDSRRRMPEGGDVRSFLASSGPGSALMRKVCWEQAGGYDESMKDFGYEDWNFWIDVTKKGWKVEVIPEYLFFYRWSQSSRRAETHKVRIQAVKKIINNHKELYCKYAEDIFCEQEKRIIETRKKVILLRESLEYKIGCFILSPLRFVQKILKK